MQTIITQYNELQQLVALINQYDWFALDTEFIRERTYHSRLCLIQVAVGDQIVGIDPLALDNLDIFFETLKNPNIIKVLHSAHQDLEIFYGMMGEVPSPIFDSQIAASVLGLGDQIGYARLVESFIGISLEKSQSRTNWSHRPLSKKQINYALDDVKYLQQIYPQMLTQLNTQNRLKWLETDFQHLTAKETYCPDLPMLWKKVKGQQNLKEVQLAILRELAIWREIKAQNNNKPRKWIIQDEIMIDLAKVQPTTMDAMQHIRTSHSKQWQQEWIQCIQKGQSTPQAEWPIHSRPKRATPSQNLITDYLMLALTYQALQHKISPAAISSRKEIEKMILKGDLKFFDGWRGTIVNDCFLNIMQGKQAIAINSEGKVVITPIN